MRRTIEPAGTRENPKDFNPNEDRYPSLRKVLHAVANHSDLPSGPVERVEVTTLASGEATARVWTARAEEPTGVYIPNVES
jgi:hypothetical protein